MTNKIKHSGIIDSIDGNRAVVRILQSSACSACKVAAHCNSSETKEKLVEVRVGEGQGFQKGDPVVVLADTAVGFRASLYGYILPLVVMIVTLIFVLKVTKSEGTAALSALGVLAPYYLMLYFFRNRIKKRLTFELQG